MYEVVLTLIETNNPGIIRDRVSQGLAPDIPFTDKRFFMYTNEGRRYYITSPVTKVLYNENGKMVFKTLNSLYELIYKETAP